jgi:pilus assembly protein Flp/PilA
MIKFIRKFVNDEAGASAAEYALILALVGTGIALAAYNLGTAVSGAMGDATACINSTNGQC